MTKILKSIHGSDKTPLKLGEVEIPCYVLEDGTRVLSGRGVQKAIGYDGSSGDWLKKFVDRLGVSDEIVAGFSNPIKFMRPDAGGSQPETYGYEATTLIDLCDAVLQLKKAGKLKPNQLIYADHAEMIIRSVAKVGIIALVDEATGYQYEREHDELQKILRAYIAEELLAWQKRFPDVFYKEIFRLNGWDYTVSTIKKRPGVIGKWTNKVIYEQLPKGVLRELKEKTPKSQAGNYTARFHQSLTEDIGNPHLQAQINSVIPLMQISDNWKQFLSHFNKMVDRRNGQTELKFEDLEYKGEPKTIEKTPFNDTLSALMKVPKPEN